MKSIKTYSQQIERLKAALETADTVVIGARSRAFYLGRICLYRRTV